MASIVKEQQEALMEYSNTIINSFNLPESLLSYLSVSNEATIVAMSGASQVADAINQNHIAVEMAEVGKTIDAMNQIHILDIGSRVLNMVNASAIISATNVAKVLTQQMNIWHDLMSVNESIIRVAKDFSLFWKKVEEEYELSSLVAQRCLKKYDWFILPSMDPYVVNDIIEVCNSSSSHKRKEINNILINYFLENDCEKLDMMSNRWSLNPLFKGRIKIIKDCINLLKSNENNINSANLIVPTLIPQIEGIQMEFTKLNGLSIDYGIVYKSNGKSLKDDSGKKMDKKSYFRQVTVNNEFYDLINDVFLDVLFKKTKPREDCTSINFSRNIILHGESTSYGRRKNMIRCFMLLDFLSELANIEN